ncbi:hypothetical protein IMZ48_03440 [Candidatus Bathyarchaeota archaeon]|nr:hypothetical protein [Candidatus Bathyarchaeota archaeon]
MPRTSPPPFPSHPILDDLLAPEPPAPYPSQHATTSPTPSSHTTGPGPAPSTLDRTPGLRPPAAQDDIEMGHISAGHRRRRSSILNPIVAPTRTSTRSLSQAIPLQDDPKITEEGAGAPGPHHQESSGGSRATTDYSEGSVSDEDLHDDEETGLTKRERERRQRTKARNTLLDQRIAPEKMNAEDKDEADQTIIKTVLVNVGLIACWYVFSLSISLVSKKKSRTPRAPLPAAGKASPCTHTRYASC